MYHIAYNRKNEMRENSFGEPTKGSETPNGAPH